MVNGVKLLILPSRVIGWGLWYVLLIHSRLPFCLPLAFLLFPIKFLLCILSPIILNELWVITNGQWCMYLCSD